MRYLFSLLASLTLILFSSCSKEPKEKQNQKPLVIVSVSPYDTFVKKIAGATIEIKTAVPANYNSHLFEPNPRQLEGFQSARLWFGIGEPFEKNLLLSLKTHAKNLTCIDLSQNLPLDAYEHQEELISSGCSHHTSHSNHHHHHQEELDRHFWTSPYLALIQTKKIAQTLIETFPEHRELYEKNLELIQIEFKETEEKIKDLLADVKGSSIIVSHPSLGYFCQDFGLIQLSIECEGKTPLPSDLKKILSLSQKYPVLCVLAQEQFDNKGALAISKHLKLPLYTINPNASDYFENFFTIAQEISKNKK